MYTPSGSRKPFFSRYERYRTLFLSILSSLLLSACSGGSNSGGGSDTQTETPPELIGIYSGEENITLAKTDSPDESKNETREVTITIVHDGTIRIRTTINANSTTGNGSLRKNNTFTLISDARNQFGGACESGRLFLDGVVSPNLVTGTYRSEALFCSGIPYTFTGSLSAGR